MITERTYHQEDLTFGVCTSCGEVSNEIVRGDGRCVECIEADIFYEETMNGCDDEWWK